MLDKLVAFLPDQRRRTTKCSYVHNLSCLKRKKDNNVKIRSEREGLADSGHALSFPVPVKVPVNDRPKCEYLLVA